MSDYKPINCSFHDRLLAFATLKKKVPIVYVDEESHSETNAIILDVFTKSGEEFMKLDNGLIIRLDKIRSVDGIELGS